jgi:hypothetical protein
MYLSKFQFITTICFVAIYSSLITQISILKKVNISFEEYYNDQYKYISKKVIDIDNIITFMLSFYWCIFVVPKVLYELFK